MHVELNPQEASVLANLAQATQMSEHNVLIEALMRFREDVSDEQVVRERMLNTTAREYSTDEVLRMLDADNPPPAKS